MSPGLSRLLNSKEIDKTNVTCSLRKQCDELLNNTVCIADICYCKQDYAFNGTQCLENDPYIPKNYDKSEEPNFLIIFVSTLVGIVIASVLFLLTAHFIRKMIEIKKRQAPILSSGPLENANQNLLHTTTAPLAEPEVVSNGDESNAINEPIEMYRLNRGLRFNFPMQLLMIGRNNMANIIYIDSPPVYEEAIKFNKDSEQVTENRPEESPPNYNWT